MKFWCRSGKLPVGGESGIGEAHENAGEIVDEHYSASEKIERERDDLPRPSTFSGSRRI